MNGSARNSTLTSRQEGNGNLNFIDDNLSHQDSDDNGESDSNSGSCDEDENMTINSNCGARDNASSAAPSWRTIWKGISIEPMMFFHMFALTMTSVVLQNLYIERICKVKLGYSDEICNHLSDPVNKETEIRIDGVASRFVTYRSLIEAGFPIIVSLFLGPWTDIHGTKWPMLLPMLGYCLSALAYVTFCYIPSAPPEALLISSAPISMVGGLVSIIMSAFSFMTKITTLENRSFRVAMLEASWFLGGPLGILTGGLIYKYSGFATVFGTASVIFLGSFIYGFLVIREELPEIHDRESRNCCADMFNVQAVKDMFATVFRKRNGIRRRWLLVMLATISLRIFALFGYLQNMYLYTRTKFSWDLKEYTEYSISDSFIAITGGYIMIMTCMKIFKVPDAIIGIISTCGIVAAQFVFAFAPSDHHYGWMMYLGATLQMFSGLISIVLRSMISKIVAKEEIARVFTFLACGEASMPLIGVPLYSYIFSHTLHTFPGAMFMVSGTTYTIVLISFIYMYFSMKDTNDHVQMEDPTESSA